MQMPLEGAKNISKMFMKLIISSGLNHTFIIFHLYYHSTAETYCEPQIPLC